MPNKRKNNRKHQSPPRKIVGKKTEQNATAEAQQKQQGAGSKPGLAPRPGKSPVKGRSNSFCPEDDHRSQESGTQETSCRTDQEKPSPGPSSQETDPRPLAQQQDPNDESKNDEGGATSQERSSDTKETCAQAEEESASGRSSTETDHPDPDDETRTDEDDATSQEFFATAHTEISSDSTAEDDQMPSDDMEHEDGAASQSEQTTETDGEQETDETSNNEHSSDVEGEREMGVLYRYFAYLLFPILAIRWCMIQLRKMFEN